MSEPAARVLSVLLLLALSAAALAGCTTPLPGDASLEDRDATDVPPTSPSGSGAPTGPGSALTPDSDASTPGVQRLTLSVRPGEPDPDGTRGILAEVGGRGDDNLSRPFAARLSVHLAEKVPQEGPDGNLTWGFDPVASWVEDIRPEDFRGQVFPAFPFPVEGAVLREGAQYRLRVEATLEDGRVLAASSDFLHDP